MNVESVLRVLNVQLRQSYSFLRLAIQQAHLVAYIQHEQMLYKMMIYVPR